MVDIHQLVVEHKELVISIRRDLHRIPETAYTEKKTSAYVEEHLRREGLEVQTGIATYGVVGLLNTGRPGPTWTRNDEFCTGPESGCEHDPHNLFQLRVYTGGLIMACAQNRACGDVFVDRHL